MQIILNGKKKEVAEDLTVSELLQSLGVQSNRVVVEHNEAVVAKEKFASLKLAANDQLEVLHFVGGG